MVHRYMSTACVHHHHGRCRHVCKFCDARCRCDCHDWEAVDRQVAEDIAGGGTEL